MLVMKFCYPNNRFRNSVIYGLDTSDDNNLFVFGKVIERLDPKIGPGVIFELGPNTQLFDETKGKVYRTIRDVELGINEDGKDGKLIVHEECDLVDIPVCNKYDIIISQDLLKEVPYDKRRIVCFASRYARDTEDGSPDDKCRNLYEQCNNLERM